MIGGILMGKVIDETGNRYGILTVIRRVENDKNGKARWLCKCDCGNEIEVVGSMLRKGNTKSCGCRILSKEKEELGKRYGHLVVEAFYGKTEAKKNLWLCRCDCGNTTIAPTGRLRRGDVTTCGCRIGRKDQATNEIGHKYGRLTVIERAKKPEGNNSTDAFWLCQCSCGNQVVVSGSRLRSGNTKSCGCLRSKGEENLALYFKENKIKYVQQKTFPDLVYIDKLKYDFAVLNEDNSIKYLVEFDGPQHTEGNCWYTEAAHIRDLIKEQYAKDHNYPLYRIPYKYRDKIHEWFEMRDML